MLLFTTNHLEFCSCFEAAAQQAYRHQFYFHSSALLIHFGFASTLSRAFAILAARDDGNKTVKHQNGSYAIKICDMMTNATKHLKMLALDLTLLLWWTTHGGIDGMMLVCCWFLFLSPFCFTGVCVKTVNSTKADDKR